jgi:hypothetical protein
LTTTETANFTCREGRRALYLVLSGQLNTHLPEIGSLLSALHRSGKRLLVLDLTCATSADPAALQWIERLTAKAAGEGVCIRMIVPNGSRLRRTLELLRFHRFVLMVQSVREALRPGRAVPA